jgi:hypothetical protein
MGFKIDDDQYKLSFGDGTRLNGATIVIGGLTIGELKLIERSPDLTPDGAEQRVQAQQELVASRLISWDLEDRNGPLPTTVEGLNRLGLAHWAELLQAWFTAITAAPDAVGNASSGGVTPSPLEVSIPTETLPASPESSPTPSS